MCCDVTLRVRLALFVIFDSYLLAVRSAFVPVQASAAVYIICQSSESF